VLVPLDPNDSKKHIKYDRILLNTTNYKQIKNYSLVEHHKVVLVVDIYVVPTGVVDLDVMEA